MDFAERGGGPVLDHIGALGGQARCVRIQVQHQSHIRDGRLRQVLEAQQGLLIVDQPQFARIAVLIVVPDIGVDEDVGPEADESRQGGPADQARRPRQPPRQTPQTRQQPGLGAPPPQAVGDDHQDHGEGGPVGIAPGGEDSEIARPVHVGQRHARALGVAIQHVVKAEIAQHQGRDQIDDHERPADEFVGRQGLDEDGQNRQQDEIGRARQDVPEQVFAELVVGIALDGLDHDAGHDADQQGRDQHQGQGQGLGNQEGPVRRRGRVDDLVDLALAIPPDQLTGIVDGDNDGDQAEGPGHGRDHHPRHQQDRRAEDLAGEQQGDDAEGQGQHDQHQIGGTAEDQRHLEGGARQQLGQSAGEAVGGCRQRAGRNRPGRRGRLVGEGAQLVGLAGLRSTDRGPVQQPGRGQDEEGDSRPQQAIAQQHPVQRGQQRILLGHGPVFGDQAEGGAAERLGPGGHAFPLGLVADHRLGDQVQDEDPDHADIGGHHRPGDRGQGEEQGRGQQQTRQGQHQIGIDIVTRPEGPEGFRIDPRHQGADQIAQADTGETQGHGGERPEEPAVQIVEFGHTGGVDQRAEPRGRVPHHHIRHNGRGGQHEEDGEDQMGLGQGEGRVLVNIAPATQADVVAGDRAEGQQAEDEGDDPEGRLAQLVAELEGGDLCKHAPGLRLRDARC